MIQYLIVETDVIFSQPRPLPLLNVYAASNRIPRLMTSVNQVHEGNRKTYEPASYSHCIDIYICMPRTAQLGASSTKENPV